jgi:hypothetical protein
VFWLCSLTALARERANCKLDAEGVEDVKRDKGSTKSDYCTFYLETGMRIMRRHRTFRTKAKYISISSPSAVKGKTYFSHRTSYTGCLKIHVIISGESSWNADNKHNFIVSELKGPNSAV